MKGIGFLLVPVLFLSGCQHNHSERAFNCTIDPSFNQISKNRGGFFTFPTSKTQAKVYLIDNTLYILGFEQGDYTGYRLAENQQQKQIKSIKDFSVILNHGDLYHDDGRSIETFSPKQKTVGFYYVEPSTGKVNSIQFLTECQKDSIELDDHNHNHDGHNHGRHPIVG